MLVGAFLNLNIVGLQGDDRILFPAYINVLIGLILNCYIMHLFRYDG